MEFLHIEQVLLIVLLGALVALAARRLRIPYTVGLVIAGLLASFLPVSFGFSLSKELLFNILLPPLIFEAALYIQWKELRRDLPLIFTYATVGVLLSAAVTAVFMHYVAGWGWEASALFAVLIAATDPVSVIATFKEAKVEGRLRLLVEAESLFNDGTAAVAFALVLAYANGQTLTFSGSAWMLAGSVFGGIICGLLVGGFAYFVIGQTSDHLVELSMTTVAAFGSFWLAEHFHMSGILATTAAGLLMGNFTALGTMTEKGEQSVGHFWDFAAFVVNAVIFIILGVNAAYQNFALFLWPILVAIFAVLAGRAIAVYPCSAAFRASRLYVSANHQHVLFWGGLRGALALALALGIPASLPYSQEIQTVTFGVVAFSVFVQGLTIPSLLRRLGEMPENRTGITKNAEDPPSKLSENVTDEEFSRIR
ncbi:MAG: sodium:proton exchanger [Acidobacteria bacterium]|nr:MAG: sodium:proton exchanger [Acidobacteriota bacterium]